MAHIFDIAPEVSPYAEGRLSGEGVKFPDTPKVTEQTSKTKLGELKVHVAVYANSAAAVDSKPKRVGARLPLHSTGVGLVLLAFAPDDLISGPARRERDDHPDRPVGPALRRRRLGKPRHADRREGENREGA